MRGRRIGGFAGRTPAWAGHGLAVPRDAGRKLTHFFGWVYQIVLWSVLVLGTFHAAFSRFDPPGPEPARARPIVTEGSLSPVYTIR